MDSLGNQVINFLDEGNREEAINAVSEYIREAAEQTGMNLCPDRDTGIYYAAVGLTAYALWIQRPGNEVYLERFREVIEAGVDAYMKTGHTKRMQPIDEMSRFQRQARELIKQYFPNAIDEYEIQGQRIDIYLPDEQIGVELDGRQHFCYCPDFHKTPADFERQQYLDREKERKCKDAGITLIRIRYDEEISMKTVLRKVTECQKQSTSTATKQT